MLDDQSLLKQPHVLCQFLIPQSRISSKIVFRKTDVAMNSAIARANWRAAKRLVLSSAWHSKKSEAGSRLRALPLRISHFPCSLILLKTYFKCRRL